MLLIEIDKTRYRRHLNRLIVVSIAFLFVGSLGIAQLLIHLFPASEGSHFHWNLLGVVSTALIMMVIFNTYKTHDFLTEVVYVWQLKKELNLIARKMTKLTPASKMGDVNAMLALQFSYSGSRQLWTLDDNLITMSRLEKSQQALDLLAEKFDVHLDISKYESALLKAF
tara:strand:+ start:44964 stop:45470 length:507 start_codon:yes stop_codon:yes gene_type:complete